MVGNRSSAGGGLVARFAPLGLRTQVSELTEEAELRLLLRVVCTILAPYGRPHTHINHAVQKQDAYGNGASSSTQRVLVRHRGCELLTQPAQLVHDHSLPPCTQRRSGVCVCVCAREEIKSTDTGRLAEAVRVANRLLGLHLLLFQLPNLLHIRPDHFISLRAPFPRFHDCCTEEPYLGRGRGRLFYLTPNRPRSFS